MAQAACSRRLALAARGRAHVSPREICGGQNGTGAWGRFITCFGFNLRHAAGGSGKTWGKAVNMHTYAI